MYFHAFLRSFLTGGLVLLSDIHNAHESTVLFRYYEKEGVQLPALPTGSLDGVTAFCRYECRSDRSLLRQFNMHRWTHDEAIEIHNGDARVVDVFTWPDGVCKATHRYCVYISADGHVRREDPGTWEVAYDGMRVVKTAIEANMKEKEMEVFNTFIDDE